MPISRLYDAEVLGHGYAEKCVTIITDDGPPDAVSYYATRKDRYLNPYHCYKKFVLAGAREHSPRGHIAGVESVDSVKDPDDACNAWER